MMNTGGREVRVKLMDISTAFHVREHWNAKVLDELPFKPVHSFYIKSEDCGADELLTVVYGIAKGNIGATEGVIGGLTVLFEDENDAMMVKLFFS